MEYKTLEFTFHNTSFFGQYWKPESIKGVVLILHGLGEHSGRFSSVAERLTQHGFGVAAFDHFGHGKTKGKRGHNPGYEKVMDSITEFIKKTKEVFGADTPLFIYGHSMGGNAVINYVLSREHTLKGLIATSPFLRLAFEPPAWKLFMGRLIQKIAPSVTLGNEVDASFISRDEAEVKKYIEDPLIHAKVSPNFSLSFMDRGEWAIEHAAKATIPTLLLHGTDDKLISYKGTEAFAKNNGKATLKLYDGAYHELHNDFCKEEVLQDITSWLDKESAI